MKYAQKHSACSQRLGCIQLHVLHASCMQATYAACYPILLVRIRAGLLTQLLVQSLLSMTQAVPLYTGGADTHRANAKVGGKASF